LQGFLIFADFVRFFRLIFFPDFARVCHFCRFWQVFSSENYFSKILLGFVIFAGFVMFCQIFSSENYFFLKISLGFVIFVDFVGFFV